jgi:hypothetical protein
MGRLSNSRYTLLIARTGTPGSNRDTRRVKAFINAVLSKRAIGIMPSAIPQVRPPSIG